MKKRIFTTKKFEDMSHFLKDGYKLVDKPSITISLDGKQWADFYCFGVKKDEETYIVLFYEPDVSRETMEEFFEQLSEEEI